MESESEESERFYFLSESAYDSDAYDPVKTRMLESQAEPTNHNASSQAFWLVYSSASAYDSNRS